jgi:hypothetical protein
MKERYQKVEGSNPSRGFLKLFIYAVNNNFMANLEKLVGVSLLLIGIVLVLEAAILIYGLMRASSALSAAAGLGGMVGGSLSGITTIINFLWIYAILRFLTGIISIISGGLVLVSKG